MTVYNLKSTLITNRDATPKVLIDSFVSGGRYSESEGYVQTYGSADGVASTYRLCQVPSNARVSAVVLQADALGSGAQLNVGVFYPTFIPVGSGLTAASAALAINTQFFCSALGCSAATTSTEVINQSTSNTIAKQEKALWDALGLASDPGIDLDIVVSVAAAVATQGYIGLKVKYLY